MVFLIFVFYLIHFIFLRSQYGDRWKRIWNLWNVFFSRSGLKLGMCLLNQKIEAKKLSERRRNLTLSRNCRVISKSRWVDLRHWQTRCRSQHLAGSEISHFQTVKVRRKKSDILSFSISIFWPRRFKVAECSFCASSCWYDSANAQGLQKTKVPSIAIFLFNQHPRYLYYISPHDWTQWIDCFNLFITRI